MKKIIKSGGTARATGSGKIAGYALVFGADHRDVYGQYFTPRTKFPANYKSLPLLYHHGAGMHGPKPIGRVTRMLRDGRGVYIEAQIDLNQPAGKAIYRDVQNGWLGFSSAPIPHLAKSNATTGEITNWPMSEISLTPSPAAPGAVTAAKAIKSKPTLRPDTLARAKRAIAASMEQHAPYPAKTGRAVQTGIRRRMASGGKGGRLAPLKGDFPRSAPAWLDAILNEFEDDPDQLRRLLEALQGSLDQMPDPGDPTFADLPPVARADPSEGADEWAQLIDQELTNKRELRKLVFGLDGEVNT